MADGTSSPSSAETAKPQFSGSEVLVAHGNEGTVRKILSGEQQTKLKRGLDRRDALRQHQEKIGRPTLAENLARRGKETYDPANTDGETKFKDAFKGSGSAEHETRAKDIIESTTNYLKYDTLRKAIDAGGGTFPKKLGEKFGINESDYKNQDGVRNKALDHILNNPTIRDTFGDLLGSVGDIDKQRDLIEETLAKDPALRAEVAKRTEDLRKRAEALPPAKIEDKEIVEAKDKKALAAEQIKYSQDQITNLMKAWAAENPGAAIDIATLQKDITYSLQFGPTGVDAMLNRIQGELARRDPNVNAILVHAEKQNLIKKLEGEIKLAKDQLGKVDTVMSAIRKPADLRDLETRLAGARSEEKTAKADVDKVKADEKYEAAIQKYTEISALTANTKDAEGNYTGSFAQELDIMAKSRQQITEADRTILTRERTMTSADKAQKANREKEEAQLLDEMENIMADSIESMILERAAALGEIEIDESDKVKAERFRKVEARMQQWSHTDRLKRKVIRDRTAIGEDIRDVAHFEEEGIQRLMLKNMFQSVDVLKDTNGDVVKLPNGNRASWDTIGLDQLPADVKATLDEAMAKYGDRFTQKLFTDYFAARGIKDITYHGPFGYEKTFGIALKDFEWAKLAEAYGDKLPESLDASNPKTAETMNKLRAAGIAPDSKKGRLLLAILLGLGGGVAGIATVGVGAVVTAAAAGGAVATAASSEIH